MMTSPLLGNEPYDNFVQLASPHPPRRQDMMSQEKLRVRIEVRADSESQVLINLEYIVGQMKNGNWTSYGGGGSGGSGLSMSYSVNVDMPPEPPLTETEIREFRATIRKKGESGG